MSKRTVFTTITPLPAGVTRSVVMETLHNHVEMIDLNPLVIERYQCKPPSYSTPEEYHCTWYTLVDKVSYLPGTDLVSSNVTYHACFNDLSSGVQTHCYAPLGLNILGKWTLGGNMPGEPREAVELGVGMPRDGLWLREDVDMRCNIMMTSFVKKTLKKSHAMLVDRLLEKAKIREVELANARLASGADETSKKSDSDLRALHSYSHSRQASLGSMHHPPPPAYAQQQQQQQQQQPYQPYPYSSVHGHDRKHSQSSYNNPLPPVPQEGQQHQPQHHHHQPQQHQTPQQTPQVNQSPYHEMSPYEFPTPQQQHAPNLFPAPLQPRAQQQQQQQQQPNPAEQQNRPQIPSQPVELEG